MIALTSAAALGALNTIIDVGGKIACNSQRIAHFANDNSLVEATHGARVEPLTIIGADCIHLEYISEILQSLQSLFSGYYLQAVSLTTQVGGVEVSGLLDKLNPARQGDLIGASLSVIGSAQGGHMAKDWRMNNQSYVDRLPTTKNKKAMAFEQISLESYVNQGSGDPRDAYYEDKNRREEERHVLDSNVIKDRSSREGAKRYEEAERAKRDSQSATERSSREAEKRAEEAERANRDKNKASKEEEESKRNKSTPSGAIISSSTIDNVREITDLSVGKLINITIGGGRNAAGEELRSVTIPISIRLMVNSIPENSLIDLLATGSMDHSLVERYHAWRAGRISFIRDLILCQDLIDEKKKAMINDKSDIHGQIVARVSNAKLAGLASRNPSLNVSSNLYVISEVTAATLEKKLGGKLNNLSTRKKIFDSGYAMIIAVVDRQWERVTFYHRGIATSTTVSLRDIKSGNRNSGPDVGDILRAYQLGSSPSL